MQPLFDMINSLQITALLPLTNITLPANAMTLFEVIVSIVAFDFFPLANPGFTETDPFSAKFDWFGFGSVNFVEDLGTFLMILIWILIAQSIIAICIHYSTDGMNYWFKHQTIKQEVSSIMSSSSWIRSKVFPLAVK